MLGNMKKHLLIILVLFICFNCSNTKFINQGKVNTSNFYYKTKFNAIKTVLILPFELDGISKNFLFDTGAELTVVQRDSIFGETFTIRGATNRTMKNGSETIKSLKIGDIDFINTFANNADLVGLKEQIPNFGGIIGRPIINKANWLIDYPKKTLEISNRELSDDTFINLPLDNSNGAPYTFLKINGKEYKVIIDLGSSSRFNVPQDSELAKALMKTIKFQNNTRERYTVGGLQTITEKVGVVPLITIGNLKFENVKMNMNISSQPRIGNSFFENCILYIDNINGTYRIKQVK